MFLVKQIHRFSFFLIVFFLLFSSSVFAVTTTISDYPRALSIDPFTVTVSVSGASTGTNYLRIDLYKEGTTNYFGETFTGTTWYAGSDGLQYFPITIQSASWSGSLQGRIGSYTSTDYDGSGTYKLRVRRYTGSGNYTSSEANNSAVTVAIVIPTYTPTPTITPTSIPTATPTKTPTPLPTTKSATITPTNIPSITSGVTKTSISATPTGSEEITVTKSILGEDTKKDIEKETPTPLVMSSQKKQSFSPFIIVGSMLLLIACGILGFVIYRTRLQGKDL